MIDMQSTVVITKTLWRIENSCLDEEYGEKAALDTFRARVIPTERINITKLIIAD